MLLNIIQHDKLKVFLYHNNASNRIYLNPQNAFKSETLIHISIYFFYIRVMFYHANNNDNRRIVSICKLNLCMLAYNEHHAQMSLIAPCERSESGAYQTFTGSKCTRNEASQLPSPRAGHSLLPRLANQQSGSSHMTSLSWPATVINYATCVQD